MAQTKAQLIAPVGSGLTLDGNLTATDLYVSTDYPSVRPALDFPFALTRKLDSRITFGRSTTGTFVDKDGFIKTSAINQPRFEYDRLTGESLGLLIEEQRVNLNTNSENIGTGYAVYRHTQTLNVGIAPDGNTTADLMTEDTTTYDMRRIEKGYALTANTSYTLSFFVKPNGRNFFGIIWFGDNGVFSHTRSVFQLTGDGTVLEQGTNATSSVQRYPNGWYRIISTNTALTTATGYVGIGFGNSQSTCASAASTYTGDGISGAYIWGIQLEAGSFATSYIPTTTATVTRSPDITSISSSNMSWFRPQEGTWVIDTYKTGGLTGTYSALFYIYPTTPNRQELWKAFSSARLRYNYYDDSGTSQVGITASNDLVSGRNKIYAAYKTNDCTLGINGVNAGTDTVATMQTSLSSSTYMGLFSVPIGSGEFWNGHISRFTYYPVKLNSTQLTNLTL